MAVRTCGQYPAGLMISGLRLGNIGGVYFNVSAAFGFNAEARRTPSPRGKTLLVFSPRFLRDLRVSALKRPPLTPPAASATGRSAARAAPARPLPARRSGQTPPALPRTPRRPPPRDSAAGPGSAPA